MGWSLVSGKKRVRVRAGQVFGRADLPDDPLLSRRHCEFKIDDGRLFVRDLSSSNGVFVDGQRIAAERFVELGARATLRLGQFTFQVQESAADASETKKFFCEAGVFLFFAVLIFSDATLDYGRSVGILGLIAILMTLLVPMVATHWLFRRGPEFLARLGWKSHAMGAFFSFLILNTMMFQINEHIPGLTPHILQTKIEYFCLRNFRDGDCSREVVRCPDCAKRMSAETRHKILENLRRAPSSQAH